MKSTVGRGNEFTTSQQLLHTQHLGLSENTLERTLCSEVGLPGWKDRLFLSLSLCH